MTWQKPAPCNWVGGNDYAACMVCGIEYDYRKVPRPPCPRLAEPVGETARDKESEPGAGSAGSEEKPVTDARHHRSGESPKPGTVIPAPTSAIAALRPIVEALRERENENPERAPRSNGRKLYEAEGALIYSAELYAAAEALSALLAEGGQT